MKIRFKQTRTKKRHGSRGIYLKKNGETREVSWADAQHLFKWWPDNFERIALSLDQLGPALRKAPKLSELSIVVTYHNIKLLESSLLSCLPHQIELIKLDNSNGRWASIAQALNYGIRKARNDIVMCVHEDTRFDPTWFDDFIKQECRLKEWGALGIVGMGRKKTIHWGSDYNTPRKIDLLDACCIILNRKNGLLFDEETFRGWHRYDFDFCLQCHGAGLGVYTLTGLAYHDSHSDGHPQEWCERIAADQKVLEKKWQAKFPELLEAAF